MCAYEDPVPCCMKCISGRLEGGVGLAVGGNCNQSGVRCGFQAEAIDLLLECDRCGAERFDAGSGGGHLRKIFVAQGVDRIQAGARLIGGGSLLSRGDGDLSNHTVDAFSHADDALEG